MVLGLLLSVNAYAGKYEMEQAAKTIPGVADAAFQGSSSFWVVMSNPNAGHDFDYYGSMLCNGCLLYTSPSPRDATLSRMPSSA